MQPLTRSRSEAMTIGQLARRVGVNLETIRYYERKGLLAAPPRTDGGYRLYGPAHERALLAVCRGRWLGFTLAEIRLLLRRGEREEQRCSEAHAIAARHLERVRTRIGRLRRVETLLAKAAALCSGGSDQECPVVGLLTNASGEAELKRFDDRS